MYERVAILLVAWFCGGMAGAVQDAAGVATTQNVTLEHGAFGLDMWAMSAHRPRGGANARRRPCLNALIAQRVATGYEASKFEVCGAVTSVPTIINYTIGKGQQQRTVIAMAFGMGVRKVVVDFGSRGRRVVSPRRLSAATAKEVGLIQFRFAAIALAGSNCLHSVVGKEADGSTAIDEHFRGCHR